MADEFSDDDEKAFSAIGDDELKEIERFMKWKAKKQQSSADRGDPGNPQSGPSSGNSPELTLNGLKSLLADPIARSTLRHLMAEADQSEATQKKKPTEIVRPAFGNLLQRK